MAERENKQKLGLVIVKREKERNRVYDGVERRKKNQVYDDRKKYCLQQQRERIGKEKRKP